MDPPSPGPGLLRLLRADGAALGSTRPHVQDGRLSGLVVYRVLGFRVWGLGFGVWGLGLAGGEGSGQGSCFKVRVGFPGSRASLGYPSRPN